MVSELTGWGKMSLPGAYAPPPKALNYTLKRWAVPTRYLDDGQAPIDNNWIKNRIRPIAIGRANWLFAGSLRAGQRLAAVMSLTQSAPA